MLSCVIKKSFIVYSSRAACYLANLKLIYFDSVAVDDDCGFMELGTYFDLKSFVFIYLLDGRKASVFL